MFRLLTAALPTIVASLVLTSPALGSSYTVTGFGDATGTQCVEVQPTLFQCPTLRNAVDAANALPDQDSISLSPGTFTLSQGQIAINQGVIIVGSGARSTIIQAAPSARVFAVNVAAQLVSMTIQGGTFAGGNGGNILVGTTATLYLYLVRVTGGTSSSGAGISNGGVLSIQNSVIDNNHASNAGGGILNDGAIGAAPELTVLDSTVARNSAEVGGGIRSSGNANNTVEVFASTVGRNTGGGISLSVAQNAGANASIIADNGGANCGVIPLTSGQFNVESGTDCGLVPADSNRQGVDPGLAADLSNQGGDTDVLTIPATSPAVDLVNPCFYPIDQRLFPRTATQGAPCDAGAYEQSATGTTPPPPPPPPPVVTPVATPVPTPEFKETVVVRPVSGKVRICLKRLDQCTDLVAGQAIPLGATIDTKKGVVELASVPKAGAPPEKAKFYDGIFKVTQNSKTTDLTLNEPLAACKKGKASAAAAKPKARKLWGDGKGKFRTRGKYSAATVRGTKWLVQDSCAGTLTRVTQGSVNVRDNVKNKTILLRAPKKYLAKPKR